MSAPSASRSAIVSRAVVSSLVLSVLCAAAICGGGDPDRRPLVDAAVLFPAGTPFVIAIDGKPCVESGKDLGVSRICNEPEVQAFFKESIELAREQIDSNVKGFAEMLGITPEDLMQLPKSRFVVGATSFQMPEGMGAEPKLDLMLAVEIRAAEKAATALLKALEAQIGAGGGESAPKDAVVGGVPARVLPVPPGGPFSSVTYFVHDGWLVAGTSAEQLEAAVTRMKTGDPAGSLASNPFYAAGMKEVARPKTVASLYVDFGFLADLMREMDDDGMKTLVAAGGLEAMKAIAIGVDLDGASIRERTFVQMTPNSALAKLQVPVDTTALLGKFPKRSILAYAASVNLKGYDEYVRKLLGAMPIPADEVKEVFTAVDEVLGPNWREDLLPNLGPEMGAFVSMPMYGLVPDVGVLIRVGDKAKVEAALARVIDRPRMKAAHRTLEHESLTINYLDLGVLGIDDDLHMRPAYAFVDGYLLVTLAPHTARNVVQSMRETGGGLLGREDFAKTFGRLKAENPDAGNLGIVYLDAQWLAGFVLDTAIPILQSAVPAEDLEDAGPLKVDLGKLPSTQAITRHLSAVVSQNQTKSGGTYGESVSPTGMIGTMALFGAVAGFVAAMRVTDMESAPPISQPPKDDEDR
jgi:hypothetical protein